MSMRLLVSTALPPDTQVKVAEESASQQWLSQQGQIKTIKQQSSELQMRLGRAARNFRALAPAVFARLIHLDAWTVPQKSVEFVETRYIMFRYTFDIHSFFWFLF